MDSGPPNLSRVCGICNLLPGQNVLSADPRFSFQFMVAMGSDLNHSDDILTDFL